MDLPQRDSLRQQIAKEIQPAGASLEMTSMDPRRAARFSEALRIELDELINYELKDPRLSPVSITEVTISPDAKKALVHVIIEGDQADTLAALEHAKAYLRSQITDRIDIFRVPDLYFEAAVSSKLTGDRAQNILKRIKKGRPRD